MGHDMILIGDGNRVFILDMRLFADFASVYYVGGYGGHPAHTGQHLGCSQAPG